MVQTYQESGLFPPGYRKTRRSSIDSNISQSSGSSSDSGVSWGSDMAAFGCDCISHNDDELEVANWLLYSTETDWAIRPSPFSQPIPKSTSSFNIFNAPGALFLQIMFAILAYWGLIPNYPLPSIPPPPRPATRYIPQKKYYPPTSIFGRDSLTRLDGSRIMYGTSEAYVLNDDIEYLVPPTPGTNEEVMRIMVSNDYSWEKIEAQPRDMLRIYRVPLDNMVAFGTYVLQYGFVGHVIRKPADSFDTIKVVRQGYVSWDLGKRDQRWMLVGRDPQEIYKILARCDKRKPPFMTRLMHLLLKFGYKLIYRFVPTWFLY